MKTIKQIVILGLASIIIHSVIQTILTKYFEWPSIERIRPLFILITMIVFIIASYLAIRRWDNMKPKYFKTLIVISTIQTITILSLTISQFFNVFVLRHDNSYNSYIPIDWLDLLLKTVIFAIVLPIIIVSLIHLGRKNYNLS